MAAKPKAGYILRSDIRRVACPTCGAQPGAFCTTFDKREHAERTTVAIAKPAPTTEAQPETGEARSQSQIAPASATPPASGTLLDAAREMIHGEQAKVLCPPPAPEPVGIRDIDEDAEPEQTFKEAVNAKPLSKEKQALIGQRVTLRVQHGPTVFFNEVGLLVALNYSQRRAEILTDVATAVVQWGANDCVAVLGDIE